MRDADGEVAAGKAHEVVHRFFFSSRRRHTRCLSDWSSDVCSSDLLRNRDFSPYIQDDIKLRPNFTINIGLRWDVMVPFTEVNNQIVFFDPSIANPAAGGLPGAATKFGTCTGCAGFTHANIRWNHFSPRFGFSYGLNNKTVLQGGVS